MPDYLSGYSSPTYRPSPFSSLDLGGMGSWGTMPAGGIAAATTAALSPTGTTSTFDAASGIKTPQFDLTGSGVGSGALSGASSVAGAGRLGLNMPTAQLALTGLSTIGNLYAAFQAQKLAKEQFNYTKNVTDTNLANQIQTYNSGIADRASNRAIVEGKTPDQTQAYINANSLRRYGS